MLAGGDLIGTSPGIPVPHLAGNPFLGLLGVGVAIPLSIRLGQRTLPRPGRVAVLAGNLGLALFALTLLGTGNSSGPNPNGGYLGARYNRCLASGGDQPITNLFAYDADGRLLNPVLLYDQSGRPIDNLCAEYDDQGRSLSTDYRRDANGAPVVNAFPLRQMVEASSFDQHAFRPALPGLPDPGTSFPVGPPAVVVPRLTTTTTTAAAPVSPGR